MPFGDQIQAGLMRPDYSAIERAGQSRGMGMQAIGQGIAGALEGFGEMKKKQSEMEKTVKQSELYIDAAMKLFPEMAPSLEQAKMQIYDVNAPLRDRFAVAESVQGLLNLSMQRMQMDSAEMGALRKFQAEEAERAARPRDSMEMTDENGNKVMVFLDPDTGEYHDSQGNQRTNYRRRGGGGAPGAGGDPTLGNLPDKLLFSADGTPVATGVDLPPEAAGLIRSAMEMDGDIPLGAVPIDDGRRGVLPARPNTASEPSIGMGIRGQLPAPLPFGTTPADAGRQPEQFSETFTISGAGGRQLLAQRNLTTGETKILDKPPSGMSWEVTTDRDGNTTVKQVAGGQAQQKHDPAEYAKGVESKRSSYLLNEAARLIGGLDKLPQDAGPVGTIVRKGAGFVPGTEAARVKERIATFDSFITQKSLQEMRLSSPTGGALGQVSNFENKMLAQSRGAFSENLPPAELKEKVTRFVREYVDVIYGNDTQLNEALKEGKVTPAQVQQAKQLREEAFRMAVAGQLTDVDEAGNIKAGAPAPRAPRVGEVSQDIFNKYDSLPQFNQE